MSFVIKDMWTGAELGEVWPWRLEISGRNSSDTQEIDDVVVDGNARFSALANELKEKISVPSPEEEYLKKEQRAETLGVLDRLLTPRQREAIVLLFGLGDGGELTPTEAAAQMSISVPTLIEHRDLALQRLRGSAVLREMAEAA